MAFAAGASGFFPNSPPPNRPPPAAGAGAAAGVLAGAAVVEVEVDAGVVPKSDGAAGVADSMSISCKDEL